MKIENLYSGREYRLWESASESWHGFFIRKDDDWTLRLKEYQLVDEDTQREAAYDEVDLYEKWKEEVWNWDTEDWYDRWRDNVDIWDYFSASDYYDYSPDVYHEFSVRGYLNDWECPDYYNQREITEDNIEEILEWIRSDDEDYYDAELVDSLKSKYWLNKITFIQTLPIR